MMWSTFYLLISVCFCSKFEGKFDVVFDKGAMDSINKIDRPK